MSRENATRTSCIGQCSVFVASEDGTITATLSKDSTVAKLKENIEQKLGIPRSSQFVMCKQRKLSDKELLFEAEEGPERMNLLHRLAGGGDTETTTGVSPAKKTWRELAKEDLMSFITETFDEKEDQEKYGQLLADQRVFSLDKLRRMNKDWLCEIGFTDVDAKLVLSGCSLRTVAVSLGDSNALLGNIRVHPCAKLSYVKNLIVKDGLCRPEQLISFLHGDVVLSPVTTEQETTWTLQAVIRKTEAGETVFVSHTRKDDSQLLATKHSGSRCDGRQVSTLQVVNKDETVMDSFPKETNRPFEELGSHYTYQQNHVLEAESPWREYKSLSNTPKGMIPFKVIDYSRTFVTGCLNKRDQGVIAFGVGDVQQGFVQGQIIGIDVTGQQDRLNEAFQYMLDNIIHRLESSKSPLKPIEQRCISLHFIRVVCDITSPMRPSQNLHVVEVQVNPEWSSLKDSVYVCGNLVKKIAGKDISSSVPDDWKFRDHYKLDGKDPQVYIREAARTRRVETVTELLPLCEGIKDLYQEKVRSKEKQREETDANEDYSDLGTKLRASLRSIDYSRFQYLLVANSVPPELRGTTELDFVMDVSWNAVFDLDAASKNDGLFTAMKRVTDSSFLDPEESKETEKVSQSCYRVVDASGLGQSDLSVGTNNFARTYEKKWIFSSGTTRGPTSVDTYDEWVKCYKKPVEDIIKVYYETAKMPIFVFLLMSATALEQIVDMIKALLGYRTGQNSLVVLSRDRRLAKQVCDMSRVDIQECCISGLPWIHVKESIRHMTGGMDLVSGKAVTSSSGTVIQVSPKNMREWTDIELVGYYECKGIQESDEAAVEARKQFYKGGQAQWVNFKHNHAIVRDKADKLKADIQRQISKLKGDTTEHQYRTRREHGLRLRIVVLQHEPGTGGTTICRHMLWKFRRKCRCALVKSLDKQSVLQIGQLYGYGEIGTDGPLLPVLLLVDQVDDQRFELFCEALDRAPSRVKAVILRCRPTLFDFQKEYSITSQGESPPIELPSRLNPKESDQVKAILKKLGKQHDGGDEKQILYLGLSLFGNEFSSDLLARFVGSHLDRASDIEREMLLFCSLVYKYMHKAIPVAFTQSLISPLERFIPDLNRANISDRTADLLLVIQDSVGDHHYSGYRPAHYLVGLQVLDSVPLVKATQRFLDKMLSGASSHVSKVLMDLTVNLFLRRDATADFDADDENVSGDLVPQEEPLKGTQKQRFSPLIMDLLSGDAKCDALLLLFDLCQKTRDNFSESEAFVWQHIARFLTYEFAEVDLPNGLNVAFSDILSKDEDLHPRNGYDSAVAAIDRAIELIRDRSSFYTTRGLVYKRQLTPFKGKSCSVDDLIRVVRLTQIACKAFHKARQCATTFNWHPLIGEIEVCLDLLKLVKDIFYKGEDCHGSAFHSFLKSKVLPQSLTDWDEADISFVRHSEQRIADNLDEIFEGEHFSKGDTRLHKRGRHLAQLRGARLQADFMTVCEIAYIKTSILHPDQPESELELRRRLADLVLQTKGEQPFSSWEPLDKSDLKQIADLLCPCVVNGRPAVQADATLVMLVRACIELRDSSPLTESDLVSIVNSWCNTNPRSKWAPFFQYIFYFPLPKPICPPDKEIIKCAVSRCQKLIQEHLKFRYLPRRSRPLYFACKKAGLSALVPPHEFSYGYHNSNEFWRSPRVLAKLLRLKGEKVKVGRILCEGIEIVFDNDLYPYESQDTLYFYLGFTIQGPYAYDPINESTLERLSQRNPNPDPGTDIDLEEDDLPGTPSAPSKAQNVAPSKAQNVAPSKAQNVAPSKAQTVLRRGSSTTGNGKNSVGKGAAGNQYSPRDFPRAGRLGEITTAQGSEPKDRTGSTQSWEPDKEQFPELPRRKGPASSQAGEWQRTDRNQAEQSIRSRTTDSTVPAVRLPAPPGTTRSPSSGSTVSLQSGRGQLEEPTRRPDSSRASPATKYQSQPRNSQFSGANIQNEALERNRVALEALQRPNPRTPTFGAEFETAQGNSSQGYVTDPLPRKTAHPSWSDMAEGIRPFPSRPSSTEAAQRAYHYVDPTERQSLGVGEYIWHMVEGVSSEADALAAVANISLVLRCEEHYKVLTEVVLKQCQIYPELMIRFCDNLRSQLKRQTAWFVGAMRDYCTKKVVEVTSRPEFNPMSYGSFICSLIQRKVLTGHHVDQIITILIGRDVRSVAACVFILSELGPSVYDLLSSVSDVDFFITALTREDRLRLLSFELQRFVQTLVKNHRDWRARHVAAINS